MLIVIGDWPPFDSELPDDSGGMSVRKSEALEKLQNSRETALNFLQKQFLSCTPVRKMDFTIFDDLLWDTEIQDEILNRTIANDLVTKYPIKRSFQLAFMRAFIRKVEEKAVEVSDDVYNSYCRLLSAVEAQDDDDDARMHHRHFLLDNSQHKLRYDNCISIRESTRIVSNGTTGLCCWQAALVLAEWCFSNKSQISGKRVFELGSGVGVTGLSVITLCAPKTYTFSDCHADVLNILCENIQLNFPQTNCFDAKECRERLKFAGKFQDTELIQVVDLDWNEIQCFLDEQKLDDAADVVLAADVLYDTELVPIFVKCLKSLLEVCEGSKKFAIVAATVRNEDTLEEFVKELGKFELSFEVESPPEVGVFLRPDESEIRIFKIQFQNGKKSSPRLERR